MQAEAGGELLGVREAGAEGKPPGSALQGTAFEAAVLLQAAPGELRSITHHQLPPSAEAVMGCLQQLMGMLRALAPPVQLVMRLDGVLLQASAGNACLACPAEGRPCVLHPCWALCWAGCDLILAHATLPTHCRMACTQAPDGSLQPASGSRRFDLPLGAALGALQRFAAGRHPARALAALSLLPFLALPFPAPPRLTTQCNTSHRHDSGVFAAARAGCASAAGGRLGS